MAPQGACGFRKINMAYIDTYILKGTHMRKVEKTQVESCGCYVQVVTEDWMGETVVSETVILCLEHM